MKKTITICDRYSALGKKRPDPKTVCLGPCEGMGFFPVKWDNDNQIYMALWREAEKIKKSKDGWHFVNCPDCNGSGVRS